MKMKTLIQKIKSWWRFRKLRKCLLKNLKNCPPWPFIDFKKLSECQPLSENSKKIGKIFYLDWTLEERK